MLGGEEQRDGASAELAPLVQVPGVQVAHAPVPVGGAEQRGQGVVVLRAQDAGQVLTGLVGHQGQAVLVGQLLVAEDLVAHARVDRALARLEQAVDAALLDVRGDGGVPGEVGAGVAGDPPVAAVEVRRDGDRVHVLVGVLVGEDVAGHADVAGLDSHHAHQPGAGLGAELLVPDPEGLHRAQRLVALAATHGSAARLSS
nr:hypothetical protein GCM10020093_075340 [Planobispora longispora]